MTFLEKVLLDQEKNDNQNFTIQNGLSYCEIPSFSNRFNKKKTVVRIVYKERGDESERHAWGRHRNNDSK